VRQKTKQEDLMVRYLFGELTEEEQSQIEEQFLTDNQYFEQLCSVEDALIDDYAQDTLTEYERRKVEGLLLSSTRQTREIEFVRDLIRYISEGSFGELDEQKSVEVKRSSKLQSLLALLRIKNQGKRFSIAVALLLMVIAVSMAIWNRTLQKKIRQMESKQAVQDIVDQELREQIEEQEHNREAVVKELEDERRKRDQLEQELVALQDSRATISRSNTAAIDLETGSFSRGGGELMVVRVRPNISRFQIRINLDKEDSYKSYGAVIKTFEGREVWSKDQISRARANVGRLVLTVPASVLANDDYTLTLKGQTEAGNMVEIREYSFRVRR
jgi:hypothetical protein